MTKIDGTSEFLRRSMMTASERALGRFMRAPDGHEGGDTGGGGDTGKPGDTPAPETVLFPKEGDKPADPPKKEGEGDGKGDGPADWKEYVADPKKSEAENAAAKAEHDKTKPAPKDDKAADADKVPDDGKYAPKMPDGVEVDQGMLDAVSPVFKEIGLTNGAAQKLTDAFAKLQQGRAEEYAKSSEGAWSMSQYDYFKKNGTPDKWVDTAKADKDIGGAKWDTTVVTARRAIDRLGTPALKEYLEASGGGNHPEIIRLIAKAGEFIKEDEPAGGDGGGNKPADAAHVLFPNDAPKG